MIYFAHFSYAYGCTLVVFVRAQAQQPHPEVVRRADDIIVVDPRSTEVIKNDDGAHYFNQDSANHDLNAKDPIPGPQPGLLVTVDEEELVRWLQAGTPQYYEWKWHTAREYPS